MRQQKPSTPRGSVLAVLVLALLAVALTGCGVGAATNEEKISKAATTYLQALADGDTAEACAQLTRRARGERCEQTMRERLPRLDSDALKNAADGSMDIDVDGNRATAGLAEPEGARFVLAKVGGEWRIDSGYTLGSAAAAAEVPATLQQITIDLREANRSGQSGTATLTDNGETETGVSLGTNVVLKVTPPKRFPGDVQIPSIHSAPCAEIRGRRGFEELSVNEVQTLTEVRDGRSETTAARSLAKLRAGGFSIAVHQPTPPFRPVVCGDIPKR